MAIKGSDPLFKRVTCPANPEIEPPIVKEELPAPPELPTFVVPPESPPPPPQAVNPTAEIDTSKASRSLFTVAF